MINKSSPQSQGGGINFGKIEKSPVYPMISGISAKDDSASATEDAAR